MCIYKITSNAYEYLDVYLDFSPLLLLLGGFFYTFWMFIWMLVVFIFLLWYDKFAWDYVRIMIFVGLWYKL